MMKYRLHLAQMMLVAAATFASCSDSYPGLDYTSGNGTDISNNESFDKIPLRVFINQQAFFSVAATRGTGAFYDEGDTYYQKYSESVFYLYAFRSGRDVQGQSTDAPDLQADRWNAAAGSDDAEGRDCLLNGPGRHGMPACLTKDMPGAFDCFFGLDENAFATHEHMQYYSTRYQDVPYNFFAYYIDDALDNNPAAGPRIETDQSDPKKMRICYEFNIDGAQDLMCGYAPFPETIAELNKKYFDGGKLNPSEEEKDRLMNIGGFSTFAAHRDVNPVIELKHQLARIDFKVRPGDKGADNITIKGIEIIDCPVHCRLIVASTDTAEVGATYDYVGDPKDEVNRVALRERCNGVSPAPELEEFHMGEKMPWSVYENDSYMMPIGGSLMIPPVNSYTVRLYFSQKREDGGPDMESYADYKLNMNAEPGYYYNVGICVYGYQKIEVKANINEWQNGGNIDIGGGYDDIYGW